MTLILSVVTSPPVEPITRDEAKLHCRVDGTADDVYIDSLIVAARRHVEQLTNRALIETTFDWWLDDFPWYSNVPILLPRNPLQSVTYIKYYDSNSTLQTWDSANYTVDTDSEVGRIFPVYDGDWPTGSRGYKKDVNIRFVAGYTDSGSSPRDYSDGIPQELKQAMLLLVGHYYKHRELTETVALSEVPHAVQALVASYRLRVFA